MKKEIFSKLSEFISIGAHVFIYTKQNNLMPYEMTVNTVWNGDKIYDKKWQIDSADVEYFAVSE